MDYCATNAVRYLRTLIVFLVLLVMMFSTAHVSAISNVSAVICRSDQGATVSIDQPKSDSVVNNSLVKITGNVSQSSQIETYVDDVFSGVVPLASDATSYATTVDVAQGTHTIKVVAVDLCQVENAEATMVMTYQPISSPSTGDSVATNVDGAVTGMETVEPQTNILDTFFVRPFHALMRSLDFVTYDVVRKDDTTINIFRFLIVLLGIMIIAFSRQLKELLLRGTKRAGLNEGFLASLRAYGRKGLITIGIIVIIFVFIT